MKRGLLGAMALALITATPAFAGHGAKHSHSVTSWGSESGEGDDGVFSLASLNGTYIFKASGSLNNGAAATADILGTLTFDGLGGVIGNLTMTAAAEREKELASLKQELSKSRDAVARIATEDANSDRQLPVTVFVNSQECSALSDNFRVFQDRAIDGGVSQPREYR